MVYILVNQLSQCLLCCNSTIFVVFNSVNNVVVCHTTFHPVIEGLLVTSSPTIYYIIEPFKIVFFKPFKAKVRRSEQIFVQFKDVYYGLKRGSLANRN